MRTAGSTSSSSRGRSSPTSCWRMRSIARRPRLSPRCSRACRRAPSPWAAPDVARSFVRYGASPRGAQALVLGAKVRALADGRYNVSVEDIKAMAVPALRHRVILNFEGEAEGVDTDTLISRVVADTEAGVAHSREPFLR